MFSHLLIFLNIHAAWAALEFFYCKWMLLNSNREVIEFQMHTSLPFVTKCTVSFILAFFVWNTEMVFFEFFQLPWWITGIAPISMIPPITSMIIAIPWIKLHLNEFEVLVSHFCTKAQELAAFLFAQYVLQNILGLDIVFVESDRYLLRQHFSFKKLWNLFQIGVMRLIYDHVFKKMKTFITPIMLREEEDTVISPTTIDEYVAELKTMLYSKQFSNFLSEETSPKVIYVMLYAKHDHVKLWYDGTCEQILYNIMVWFHFWSLISILPWLTNQQPYIQDIFIWFVVWIHYWKEFKQNTGPNSILQFVYSMSLLATTLIIQAELPHQPLFLSTTIVVSANALSYWIPLLDDNYRTVSAWLKKYVDRINMSGWLQAKITSNLIKILGLINTIHLFLSQILLVHRRNLFHVFFIHIILTFNSIAIILMWQAGWLKPSVQTIDTNYFASKQQQQQEQQQGKDIEDESWLDVGHSESNKKSQ